MSLRAAWDRWAVVWWPARASTAALVARHQELTAELRDRGVDSIMALAEMGPIARELDRREVDTGREPG